MGDTLPLPALGPDGRPVEADPARDALLHLLAAIGVEPRTSVLVAGCGDGALPLAAAELVGPRGRVLGLDPAPDAADATRRRGAERALGQLEVRTGDPGVLGPDDRFDSVLVASSLLPRESEFLLVQLAARLRPHGSLAVIELDALAPAAPAGGRAAREPDPVSGAAFAPVALGTGAPATELDGALPWRLGRAGLSRPAVALATPAGGGPPRIVAAWSRVGPAPR